MLEYYQNKLLNTLNIPYNIFKIKNINTLHIKSNNINAPIIVIIHGFASGLATFVKLYKKLYKKYEIYAIDLIGYGLSTKIIFSNNNIISENIFIDSIEEWRKELNLKSIILCGHSFGCYLIINYYNKYSLNVKSLILIEPWNFSDKRENKLIYKLPAINFIKFLKFLKPLSYYLMYLLSFDICKNISINLKNDIFNYLYYINISSTGEQGFFSIIESFFYPIKPLKIKDNNIKIKIIYGENTWLDIVSGIEFYKKRKRNTQLFIIKNCAHQLYGEQLDNLIKIIYK
jgi:pimeloyl-ACP methyl ester carboxylesterase